MWSISMTVRTRSAASKHPVTVMLVAGGALYGLMAKPSGTHLTPVLMISLANSAMMVIDILLVVWFSSQNRRLFGAR